MSKINCSKCGTENESTSKFCQKCGQELIGQNSNLIDKNPKKRIISWWNRQSRSNKILTGVGSCCLGIILFLIFMMAVFPVTNLSVESNQVQIDNQTTEYTIQGKSEPNATVKITAPLLNLNDTIINVDNNGSFIYKVFIPINVTETDLNITAKSPNKSQIGEKINIQRPLTPLTVTPMNISSNTTTCVIQGKTDPNASITINSKDLNLTNIQLIADENGNFNQSVTVQVDIKTAEIEEKANSTGKRSNTQKINVTRESQAPEPTTTTSNVTAPVATPSSTDTTNSKSKSFPITPPDGAKVSCPNCGSYNNVVTNEIPTNGKYLDYYDCHNCGYSWNELFSTSIFDDLNNN